VLILPVAQTAKQKRARNFLDNFEVAALPRISRMEDADPKLDGLANVEARKFTAGDLSWKSFVTQANF
jgi:hypothetical protein